MTNIHVQVHENRQIPNAEIDQLNPIIVLDSDTYQDIGKWFAMKTSRQLYVIQDWNELGFNFVADTITLVAAPEQFTVTLFDQMLTLDIPYGIITGRTRESAYEFAERCVQPRPETQIKTLTMMQNFDKPVQCDTKENKIVGRRDISGEQVLADSKNYNVLNLLCHSHEDKLFLGRDVLMVRSQMAEDSQRPGYRDSSVYFLEDLAFEHYLINSCLSLCFRSLLPMDRLFGIRTVELTRTLSYIGTTRMKDGRASENLFYSKLLKSGYRLGDIVRLLNQNMSYLKFESPCYLLLGDPARKVTGEEGNRCEYQLDIREDDTFSLSIESGDFVSFPVPSHYDAREQYYLEVVNCNQKLTALSSYSILQKRDGLTVFVYFDNPVTNLNLEFRLVTYSHVVDEVDQHQSFLRNGEQLKVMKFFPKEIEGKLSTYSLELKGLLRFFEDLSGLTVLQGLRKKLEFLNGLKTEIQSVIISKISQEAKKNKLRFMNEYRNQLYVKNDTLSVQCSTCSMTASHQKLCCFIDSTVKRGINLCGMCGTAFEYDENCTENVAFSLQVFPNQEGKRTFELVLQIHNNGTRIKTFTLIPLIEKTNPQDEELEYNREPLVVPVEGGTTHEWRLEVHATVTDFTKHLARIFLLENGTLNWFAKSLFLDQGVIVEQPSYEMNKLA